MGIRFQCPGCQRSLNVKTYLAGKRGICPKCSERFTIPESDQIAESAAVASGARSQSQLEDARPIDSVSHRGRPHVAGSHVSNTRVVAGKPAVASSEELERSPLPPQAATRKPRPAPDWDDQQSAGEIARDSQTVGSGVGAAEPGKSPGGSEGETPESLGQAFENLDPSSFVLDQPASQHADLPSDYFDWIADSPQSVWYVRHPNGSQYGPAIGRQMRSWVEEGRVSEGSHVWREGWAHWRQAVDVFPQIRPPASNTVPASSKPLPAAPAPADPASSALAEPMVRQSNRWLFPAVLSLLFVLALIVGGVVYQILNQLQQQGSGAAETPGLQRSGDDEAIVDPFAAEPSESTDSQDQ